MTIGHAEQKGTLIYIYDVDGRQTTSISAPGRWPDDGLKGFTAQSVHVQKGTLIYAYDETGHQVGRPLPVQHGNVEYMKVAQNRQLQKTEQILLNKKHRQDALSA